VDVDVLDLSFSLGNDTTICAGSTYLLTPIVTNGVSYLWSDNSTNSSISIQTAETYSLTIESQGCSATDEIVIDVLDLSFDLGVDTLFCVNQSVTIAPVVEPGSSFLWSTTSTNSSITINTEGQYYLDIENIGCTASDTIYVSELDLTFTLGNDTTICEGASLLLNPVVLPGVSFDWSTNQTSSNIAVTTSGIYELIIEQSGCQASDIIDVDVLNLAFTLGPDTTICNVSSLTIQPDVLPGVNYSWSTGSTSNNITVTDADTYTLDIDSLGCTAQDEIEVGVFYVNAIVPADIQICLNDTADVIATGVDSLVWNSGSSLIEHYTEIHFGLYPSTTTTFDWTAYENGCTENGTTTVDVLQPYVPVAVYDDFYCSNEYEFIFPDILGTTGDFYFENLLVSELLISGIASGNHEIEYRYIDNANSCPWQIDLPFEITDTTSLSILMQPTPLCNYSSPVDFTANVNVSGGQWYVKYDGENWVQDALFNPDGIQNWDELSPINVPMRYEFINIAGCISHIETSVTVHPTPIIDIFISEACAGSDVTFINNSFVIGSMLSSLWSFEQHGNTNQWQPLGIDYEQAGEYGYSLIVTSEIGCEITTQGDIIIHPNPVAEFEWQGGCVDEPLTFHDSSSIAQGEITGYDWTIVGNTFSDSPVAEYTFSPAGNHNVTLEVESAYGCMSNITHTVEILPIPTGAILTNNHCFGENTEIASQYSTASGNIISSSWNIANEINNVSAPILTHVFSSVGVYQIEQTIESENGCINILRDSINILRDSIEVYPLPVPSFFTDDFELCLNDADTLSATSQVDAPFYITNHHWSFSNGYNVEGPSVIFRGEPEGLIHLDLTAISNVGCTSSITTNDVYLVRPNPLADFNLSPDVLSYEQPKVEVEDNSEGSTIWYYTVSDGNNSDQPDFVHEFQVDGTYDITQIVTNQFGCKDTAVKSILFVPGLLVHIPNAFTPDADGLNDVFHPVISGDAITDYHFIIWDRWGMEIFNSTNPEEVWVGNVNGGEHYAKTEIYNYRLIVKGKSTDELVFKGSVALLR